jgi:hypothetical protein
VNAGQPNVYQSPKLRTLLTDKQLGIVARIVSDYEGGAYPKTTGGDAATDALNDVQTQIGNTGDAAPGFTNTQAKNIGAKLFAAVAFRKTDSFLDFNPVYKRTLTAALAQQVQASFVGYGKIWTSAEVAAFEQTPFTLGFFNLPPDLQWIKHPPVVVAVYGQKTQVTYQYQACKKATALLYDPFGAAQLLDAGPY